MSHLPEWKKALQEPNAIGWIGLFILVIIIGFGALYLGGNHRSAGRSAADHLVHVVK